MLKTNKLVSLGVLSVIGLGLAVAPTVSAANNSNTTTFGYTAGQAGGDDNSDWILDMPVQINLTDKNQGEAQTNGAELPFSLKTAYGTNKGQAYNGNSTVTVKLGQLKSENINSSNIVMNKGSNKGTGTVEMTLVDKDGQTITPKTDGDSDKAVATLDKTTPSATAKAGITKSGDFVKGDTFNVTLTWSISDSNAG